MLADLTKSKAFESINPGYDATFQAGKLSIGLVVPIESYPSTLAPTLERHVERVQLAERHGFSSVWLRDVPLNVPTFGDAGQGFDPFDYLGFLAAQTETIALGVASTILPLRHPAHVAKAAATADVLSNGRLILGIASGDRPEEYPALGIPYDERGARFRESYDYIRRAAENEPRFDNRFGSISRGMDMLPKPVGRRLPLLITGRSQQSPDWIAEHGDGWITYPRPAFHQSTLIDEYRERVDAAGQPNKPVMEPLYVDLSDDPDAPPRPIHLGLSLGMNALRDYLKSREKIGVNHVALNLRFNSHNIEQILDALAADLLPDFQK